MNKLIAAIVMSTLALGSATGFAAEAAKKDELTQEQRADMRNRAEKLTAERAAAPSAVKAKHSAMAKKHHATTAHKASRHNTVKTPPK